MRSSSSGRAGWPSVHRRSRRPVAATSAQNPGVAFRPVLVTTLAPPRSVGRSRPGAPNQACWPRWRPSAGAHGPGPATACRRRGRTVARGPDGRLPRGCGDDPARRALVPRRVRRRLLLGAGGAEHRAAHGDADAARPGRPDPAGRRARSRPACARRSPGAAQPRGAGVDVPLVVTVAPVVPPPVLDRCRSTSQC